MLIKTVFIFGLVVFTTYSSEDKKDIPINDFAALVNDLKQALNLDRVFEVIHQYLKTAINNGQKYSYQQFKDDWRNLKVHPVDIAKFVHQSIWAIIVNGSLAIIKVFYYYHNFFLEYLKKKCDIYFEKIDPFHPWNVMEQENKQTPLYLFIYGGILSLVFMRFLSSWNFLLYIAASFLVHYIGGTPLVFKCRFILPWMAVDRMPHSSQILPERFRQNEIKTLQSRLKNMEEKTYLINERLERLYTLIDKKENE
ncbi:uncharacterized protein LOC105846623 isoform X2 [Hydra vulgaris]|uniref:uncharacterized protein LOC105846623 isoform X2 n=1 Tax=Hydra vulgaris TaxID=6087 RepID=UPI0032E9E1D8